MFTPHRSLTPADLAAAAGLGVAGNFAGHLEQAGEADDFRNVASAAGRPKGVFPFYMPPAAEPTEPDIQPLDDAPPAAGVPVRLRVNPLTGGPLVLPTRDARLQIEPELGLWCELTYDEGGRVARVTPTAAGAFNDCSWRDPPAPPAAGPPLRISQKKNWGPGSQGFASGALFPIDRFARDAPVGRLRLASFLRRQGVLHPYGEDAPVLGYGTFFGELLDWLVETLAQQTEAGPLEDVGRMLRAAGRPRHAVIAAGATRYLPFGETTFLKPGDAAIVAVYDAGVTDAAALRDALARDVPPPGTSVLTQSVAARRADV